MNSELIAADSRQLRGENISWIRPSQRADFVAQFDGHQSRVLP
jgi:hypothetical protein